MWCSQSEVQSLVKRFRKLKAWLVCSICKQLVRKKGIARCHSQICLRPESVSCVPKRFDVGPIYRLSYRSRASFWPSRVAAHFQLGQATPACDSPCSCQSQLMRSVLCAAGAVFGCSHSALVCCMLAPYQGS